MFVRAAVLSVLGVALVGVGVGAGKVDVISDAARSTLVVIDVGSSGLTVDASYTANEDAAAGTAYAIEVSAPEGAGVGSAKLEGENPLSLEVPVTCTDGGVECRSDADCVHDVTVCHPHTCMTQAEQAAATPYDGACTELFDYGAAYQDADCLCCAGVCTNRNEGRTTEESKPKTCEDLEPPAYGCESDADCVHDVTECHPHVCVSPEAQAASTPWTGACTKIFDIHAAYTDEDCLCCNNVCTNRNEKRTTETEAPKCGDGGAETTGECEVDSDCVHDVTQCHPHTCMTLDEQAKAIPYTGACDLLFDFSAAYQDSDCLCCNKQCVNKNQDRKTDDEKAPSTCTELGFASQPRDVKEVVLECTTDADCAPDWETCHAHSCRAVPDNGTAPLPTQECTELFDLHAAYTVEDCLCCSNRCVNRNLHRETSEKEAPSTCDDIDLKRECASDSDCVHDASMCHPMTCLTRDEAKMSSAQSEAACSALFNCNAAYTDSDCLCCNGICTNKNAEKKSCEADDEFECSAFGSAAPKRHGVTLMATLFAAIAGAGVGGVGGAPSRSLLMAAALVAVVRPAFAACEGEVVVAIAGRQARTLGQPALVLRAAGSASPVALETPVRVTANMTYNTAYHGGAAPSEEVLNEAAEVRALASTKIYLRKMGAEPVFNSIFEPAIELTTAADGTFDATLEANTKYLIIVCPAKLSFLDFSPDTTCQDSSEGSVTAWEFFEGTSRTATLDTANVEDSYFIHDPYDCNPCALPRP